MMTSLNLINSPRLYVTADVAENLNNKLHSPYLQTMAKRVLRDADGLVEAAPIREGERKTYQDGTRTINSRLGCLTCAWVLTGKESYRKAATRHLESLLEWNHISCEANSSIPADVELPFCLSYGELSHSVGLMYDLFRQQMTDAEQAVFLAVFDRFLMKEAVKCLDKAPWWANKAWSNWNGVCAGGMGVMALALYDDVPEARALIPFVEKSLDPYFKSYSENGGGCPEGTGYWNYGMSNAMRYVLSWENATGKKHPALQIKELRKSLLFPVDFTGISFGDNDGWHPSCFYFLLANRLDNKHAALNAAAYLPETVDTGTEFKHNRVANGDILYSADVIPTPAEMAELKAAHAKEKVPVARIYDGMDWAALADDEAFPTLRMAIRGGSSEIKGHGMLDLLSFRCRVNEELIITDQTDGSYMASTFSGRGIELYGRSAASKSTLFVDGLGCASNSSCDKTEVIEGDGLLGIRIDASHIYLPRWKEYFIGRLFLMVENSYWLVVDHVLTPKSVNHSWAESRFHTLAECRRSESAVSLSSGKQTVQMTFAALGEGVLLESTGMPSQPTVPRTRIFRWMGAEAAHDNLHVTALNPGDSPLQVDISKEGEDAYRVAVREDGGKTRQIRLNSHLEPQA